MNEQSSADPLENRLEFETLISDLSSRFINLPPAEVDHEILSEVKGRSWTARSGRISSKS